MKSKAILTAKVKESLLEQIKANCLKSDGNISYPALRDSLEERLVAYMIREAGIRDTVDLAEGELDDLVAFLGSLTGQIDREYIATAD